MSKVIKQMEMDALKSTFNGVSDMVVLTSTKVSCQNDHSIRATLRKKKIRVQMVKNSLARRVFSELGIKCDKVWEGNTLFAWGAGSLAELSKEVDALVKKNDKILKVKAAISESQAIEFKTALAMPTRAEAIARVVGLALAPAGRLVSQFKAPGATLASQIKTLSEKEEAAPAAAT